MEKKIFVVCKMQGIDLELDFQRQEFETEWQKRMNSVFDIDVINGFTGDFNIWWRENEYRIDEIINKTGDDLFG